jgi:hypothetical protein
MSGSFTTVFSELARYKLDLVSAQKGAKGTR